MINEQLINPQSIVIVGGSNNVSKPGGKIVKNIIQGEFKGDLYVVNPRENQVQGIRCQKSVDELPQVDLAILAIAAHHCLPAIEILTKEKNTKAFIIISAGFSEAKDAGRELEEKVVKTIEAVGGCLIGPNCIGLMNVNYAGVFTQPTPKMTIDGCDLISGSGATALFSMEAGIPNGLRFNSVFSVGNSAQIGVEEVLEYMDETYDPKTSSSIKLLYMENIQKPNKLFKHASSLINKGCRIAAIKAGATEAGSLAAASHTGAVANPDMAVRALFRKAGIVSCDSREELISVASVFSYKKLIGKNIGIITHAGGSAVLLTDALTKGGLNVPEIKGPDADELLTYLNPGSYIRNPIDFIATGTAEQLGIIIDYCEHKFDNIDAMVVVFGSPGLFDVENVYKVLNVKLEVSSKPIYPVLPSLVNAKKEISYFLSKGHVNFPDEVTLGRALCAVHQTPKPSTAFPESPEIDEATIHEIIHTTEDGFISAEKVTTILKACGIPVPKEEYAETVEEAIEISNSIGYPVAMKVVGVLHKSDVGGVKLNVRNAAAAEKEFKSLMSIEGTTAVLIQSMHQGHELFIGAKYEKGFGHLVLVGLGGIFIEVMKDLSAGLAPLGKEEVRQMIHNLRGYPLFQGIRGKEGIDEDAYIDIVQRVSVLVNKFPEIAELDINPVLAEGKNVVAVDARIRLASLLS